jgi:predicted DNA-binding transcriptional regulator YafY
MEKREQRAEVPKRRNKTSIERGRKYALLLNGKQSGQDFRDLAAIFGVDARQIARDLQNYKLSERV